MEAVIKQSLCLSRPKAGAIAFMLIGLADVVRENRPLQ